MDDDKTKPTVQNAWLAFAKTGQVSDYLNYYAAAHPGGQEESFHANQDPGTDHSGTEYR